MQLSIETTPVKAALSVFLCIERGNTFVVVFKVKGVFDLIPQALMQQINERQQLILSFLLKSGKVSSTQILEELNLSIAVRD